MTDISQPPIPFGAPKQRRNIAIDESMEVTRQLLHQPKEPEPTYTSCVADSIHECRYLDLKGIAKEILGEPPKKIESPAELADLMAEWAASNKTGATP